MNQQRSMKVAASVLLALVGLILPAAMLLRAENTAKPMMSHDFTDVPVVGQEFMEPYINELYHQGITGGCSVSPLMYCPTNNVTRGSMAVFIGRALGYVDMTNDGFAARAYFKQTGTAMTDHGVIGRTTNGYGVLGTSEDGAGVYGISSTDSGVFGISDSGYGVYGSSNGVGVAGSSSTDTGVSGTSSSGSGVRGDSLSSYGVYGTSTNSYGMYGSSTSGPGVYGSSSSTYGVSASSNSGTALLASSGTQSTFDSIYDITLGGVSGELFGSALRLYSNENVNIELDNNNNSDVSHNEFIIQNGANEIIFSVNEAGTVQTKQIVAYNDISGVALFGNSTYDYGVFGFSTSAPAIYAYSETDSGLLAEAGDDSSSDFIYDLVLRGALGEINGLLLHLVSYDDFIIDLDEDNNGSDVFSIRNSGNTVVFQVTEAGGMFATGSKSAIVDTVSYGTRAMYAVEATEVLFEDVGSADLVDGEAVITIDPMFAETVNLEEEYHVFLTPVGGWADLYVAEMTETSFTVRSADGSDVQFSYRIVAKRLGYEDVRMEEINP